MEIQIGSMSPDDWNEVRRIYLEGIATGDATFETDAPAWDRWDATHRPGERFVAREGGAVLGWAALSPVSDRCVYGGVAEVSVYVAAAARGNGLGVALLRHLSREPRQRGAPRTAGLSGSGPPGAPRETTGGLARRASPRTAQRPVRGLTRLGLSL